MPQRFSGHLSEVIKGFTSAQVKIYVQPYEASPEQDFFYMGAFNIDGAVTQSRGESDEIKRPSDSQRNKWVTVGKVKKDIEPGTLTGNQPASQEMVDDWDWMHKNNFELNVKLVIHPDAAPQAVDSWEGQIILHKCEITELGRGENLNPRTGDDNAEINLTISLRFSDYSIVKKLTFAERAETAVARAVLAIKSRLVKWRRHIYVLTGATATSAPSAIAWSTDDGDTWDSFEPAALNTDDAANDAAIVGDYLLICSQANESHLFARLRDIDAGDDTFVEVAGYTATKGPNAIYPRSITGVLLAGQGGYIYKLRGVNRAPSIVHAGTLAAQNLNDIDGYKLTVVAVGASNTVLASYDGGTSWELITGPAVGVALKCVKVMTDDLWYIGTANGKLFYTVDGGDNWTEIVVGDGIGSVNAIEFSDEINGALVATTGGGAGVVYRTNNAGATWNNDVPDLRKLPTSTAITCLEMPDPNEIFVGGTKTGPDGIVALAF